MCGVIGLIYERQRPDLGRVAAELLKTLEYRGYDSTGAAFQGDGEAVRLLKGVGAPSAMVHKLGIVDQAGQLLCGQVRWATFGAVTEANSQPHVVRCKTHLYGAHNGNVTNCDALKAWLTSEGHKVLSDNDGEMVVHTVEHAFALGLEALAPAERSQAEARRATMRAAIAEAAARLEGSFAAVVVDPVSRTAWAMKLGSSLYFGVGTDPTFGHFGLASSDLSSVLKLTHVLVPMSEGEVMEFDATSHRLYGLDRKNGPRAAPLRRLERSPVRSRLRAEDTALLPPFETFMDQEIAAQEATVKNVVRLFHGGSENGKAVQRELAAVPPQSLATVKAQLAALRDEFDDDRIRAGFTSLVDSGAFRAVVERLPAPLRRALSERPEHLPERLVSAEAAFLLDLAAGARGQGDVLAVSVLDALIEQEEVAEFEEAAARFASLAVDAVERGGRLLVTCCGSSFHAAKAGALFFNEVAHVELVPMLPGEFRGQTSRSLRDGDLVVAVSQSGETKDLVDVLNDVIATGKAVARVGIVNNVNSTIAQEKSQVVIPLRCGPEVAVPATKSFMNQVAIFYGLALKVAARRAEAGKLSADERGELEAQVAARWEKLATLPALLRATFETTGTEIDAAAQMLFLRPSLHLLATRISAVAREGALKIREVVLNHSEGFEASEFKHGPNTLLGFNTVFGPQQLVALLQHLGQVLDKAIEGAAKRKLPPQSVRRLVQAITDSAISPAPAFSLSAPEQALLEATLKRDEVVGSLYADYPLIYITGPDDRDVALTVSQINTHKIRGASTVIIAEESAALRTAASKAPVDNPAYRWAYIALPRTQDTLLTVFSSTLVLQRLALKMSLLKMQYLDRLGIREHGVHPDVPKNVSKSITVD